MVTFTVFYKLNHKMLLLSAAKKYCDQTRYLEKRICVIYLSKTAQTLYFVLLHHKMSAQV